MLKDDRMMGMLTFVVIMLAFGTLVQRAEFFQTLFGPDAPAPELKVDEVTARASEPVIVDVLANDEKIAAGDAARLAIVAPPKCGSASVREGKIHYLGSRNCVGAQTLRYGLGGEQTAALRIAVEPAGGNRDEPAARASEPAARKSQPPADESQPPVQESQPTAREDEPARPPREMAAAQAEDDEDPLGLRRRVRIGRLPGVAADDTTETAQPGGAGAAARPAGPGDTAGDAARNATAQGDTDTARPAQSAAADQAQTATAATGPSAAGPAGPAPTAAAPGSDCKLLPTLTLDLGPGATTGVSVDSPCHAGTVAELTYDGLRFAIPIDARGSGRLAAPGFQRSTEATLALAGIEPMTFTIPFQDIDRIDRVAVTWEAEAGLALNAFEFGARPGSAGHVRPGAPRSFEAVRRQGGGWLTTYDPTKGKGQRVEVYSFWRRYVGPSGVVKLGLDPSSPGDRCAGAAAAGANYTVLRSVAGHIERARLGRIGRLDCTRLAGGTDAFMGDAVDDLIVRRK